MKKCWWCEDEYPDDDYFNIRHYKSGYLCTQCREYLNTFSGDYDPETPVEEQEDNND